MELTENQNQRHQLMPQKSEFTNRMPRRKTFTF